MYAAEIIPTRAGEIGSRRQELGLATALATAGIGAAPTALILSIALLLTRKRLRGSDGERG